MSKSVDARGLLRGRGRKDDRYRCETTVVAKMQWSWDWRSGQAKAADVSR